jgi:hypothetical protein
VGEFVMADLYAIPGSPCPVFVSGIEYKSIYRAALETRISAIWLTNSIKKNNGAPVVIKNQMVVTRSWVSGRIDNKGVTA